MLDAFYMQFYKYFIGFPRLVKNMVPDHWAMIDDLVLV